ncbi:MAG: HD domain-containing protein [Lachnospiraceae bacterium]|nr:HD domain-containing protein [Lachnospiraceae bacterium]
MITTLYGILLILSVIIVIYMAQKNYENVDINYWTLVLIIPLIVLGYWLKTRVTTTEGAMVAFCFLYLDSTVLPTVLLFSVLHFAGVKVKPWVKILVYSLAYAHLLLVWVCMNNDLYYKTIKLVDTGMGTATKMTGGPLRVFHWIFMFVLLLYIVAIIVFAFIKKGNYSRRSLLFYSLGIGIGLVMYTVESVFDFDFSFLPVLYVAADCIIALDYDHACAHDIMSLMNEHQRYHGVRGYVAIDLDGNFLSCNERAYLFLPGLKDQIVDAKFPEYSEESTIFYELVNEYRDDLNTAKVFTSGDMTCRCEISEFFVRRDGRVQGYLFDIRDVTEEQKVIDVMRDYNDSLNSEVAKKTENIVNIQQRIVLGLANMVENRDNNTGGHVKRTSDIIKIIVDEMEKQGVYHLDRQFADDVVRAAPMHDLGKITIENAILLKPARLSPGEFDTMKTHAAKSGEFVDIILRGVEEQHFVDIAYNVARYHHERWDGRGYPEGLVGEMIPVEARIMSIADVYDALVSKRCYKEALSFERAAEIMAEGMGTQFDPNMLSVFIACREDLENYYRNNAGA